METAVGDCLLDLINLVHTDIRGVMCSFASFLNVLTLDSNYSDFVSRDFHIVYLIRIA